ncbi:MAG: sugar phosphate isomerase/epimerase [Rhodothermales bacterium]|jgi:sugar phosphate isomerase/epimerase
MRFLLLALIGHLAVAADFDPPLFVFQNGLRFANLAEESATLKKLGYAGVGSAKLPGLEERIAAYKSAGLRVCSIYVGAKVSDTDASFDAGIPKAIELLKGSGAVVELTLRGKAKTDEQAVAIVREVAELAAAADLKVVLYPHAGFYVARVPEALRVAKAVDRPNVGIMFNLCHFLKSEKAADLEKTITEAGPYLFQASTCGADTDGKNWGALIQTLEKGSFDQERLFAALKSVGFSGIVGLQCYAIKGDSKANLTRSGEAWQALRKSF